jgi:hypothetical protein
MKILAIDPGPESSAYVIWDGKTILNSGIVLNEVMREILGGHADCECLIEMVESYGMPVGRDVFETVFWIGRFYERWVDWLAPIIGRSSDHIQRIPRGQIKLHHCHSRRAKDSNIRAALIDKYGKPGTKKDPGVTYGLKEDLWAAFALATFWSETHCT